MFSQVILGEGSNHICDAGQGLINENLYEKLCSHVYFLLAADKKQYGELYAILKVMIWYCKHMYLQLLAIFRLSRIIRCSF